MKSDLTVNFKNQKILPYPWKLLSYGQSSQEEKGYICKKVYGSGAGYACKNVGGSEVLNLRELDKEDHRAW